MKVLKNTAHKGCDKSTYGIYYKRVNILKVE